MFEKEITLKMINNFKKNLENEEKSTNTINKYMHDINHFYLFTLGNSIDKSTVLRYKNYLKETYALSSANSKIAALNSFFKFAGFQELCVKQFKLQLKTYCCEDSELTKAEYFSLIKAARKCKNSRLSLLIQTICSTGIRVSELKYITVEAVNNSEATVTCKGKTRKIFIIPMLGKKLKKYIKSKCIESGPVFITKSGKPLDRCNIWRELKKLCSVANVSAKKVFPHNLRHLFARTFYNIEKDIVKLADILGHTNINTTRIYIVTTGEEHRKRIEKMHLLL